MASHIYLKTAVSLLTLVVIAHEIAPRHPFPVLYVVICILVLLSWLTTNPS